MHDANAPGRGMESDSVQLVRLYETSLRDELDGDASCLDPRRLPDQEDLFLRPTVLGRGIAARV